MALHFHPLTITKIKKETKNCVVIRFDIPETLKETFRFDHGQNVTVEATIDGTKVRRSYSICSAPYENELTIAVKKVQDGIFSTFANEELKEGAVLQVLPPTGKFNTKLDPAKKKKYVAFACGSGITPILSIIKTTLHTEPKSEFVLVYSNRSRSTIIFFEELEALKNQYMNRFTLVPILSREKTEAPISFGRIDKEKLEKLGKIIDYPGTNEFFICGPEEMIFTTKNYLEALDLDTKKIHFELFATTTAQMQTVKTDATEDLSPKSNITVILDGRSFDFKLGFESHSVLDAALLEGADLPYACKGGVCCTCKAKLIEGEVEMDVNYALEPEEVAAGFILTCQSHPITEKLVVDFDIK